MADEAQPAPAPADASQKRESGAAGPAVGTGYFGQHEETDSAASRGIYRFDSFSNEQVVDVIARRRIDDEDHAARLSAERRFIEEEHSAKMRLIERNDAAQGQLVAMVAAILAMAGLGTQNADQNTMSALTASLAGILAKALTQVPPISTATGNAGK